MVTCGFVSHICPVTVGITSGRSFDIWRGARSATCARRSRALDFTLHSGLRSASNNTGTTREGTARGLTMHTIDSDASPAASLTGPDDEPHSSRAAARRGTTYGSADLDASGPISHRARRKRRAPSRALGGVVLPFPLSVPTVEVPEIDIDARSNPEEEAAAWSESALAMLTALAILLIPPPGCTPSPGPFPNTAPMPRGSRAFSISDRTPHFFRTATGPSLPTRTARSAAARPRLWVVDAVRGADMPSWKVARSPRRWGRNSLIMRSRCVSKGRERKVSRGDGPPPGRGTWDSSDDGLSTGAEPRRCSCGLPVWEDEEAEEEEEEEEEEGRGAWGCFIFEDVPDFSMPDDDLPPLPFLTTLIPVDDFLTPTLWVVEAPIDVMAFAKGNIFIYYNSMRKAAARGPEERIDNIEQCVGDSQLGSNQTNRWFLAWSVRAFSFFSLVLGTGGS